MSDTFKIKFDFMEKWGRFAKAEYLQIYLFILYIIRNAPQRNLAKLQADAKPRKR